MVLGFLCLGSVVSGCSKVSSEGLPTAEIYAELHVAQIDAGAVLAQARLRQGSDHANTYVELQGGDDLIASIRQPFGDISISGDLFGPLREATRSYRLMTGGPQQSGADLFFPDYSNVYDVTLPLPDAAQPVFIGLHRDGQVSAPDSQAVLPPPFELITPQSGEIHAANSDLAVAWSRATLGYAMVLTANSRCSDGSMSVTVQSITQDKDTGRAALAAGSLRPASAATCNVTVSVDRWQSGTLDAHFAGGRIRSHQIRKAVISVPAQ